MVEISAKTRWCGVIGNPVEHSLSPAIHNSAFQHLHLDYVYLAFQVADLEGAIRGIQALGNCRGLSVTIPHKVAVMGLLDEVETTAAHIGSVNTIVKEADGRLVGHNTDAQGALRALREGGVDLCEQRVLLLGSGGAARAIAFGLAMEGSAKQLTILGVDAVERARLVQHLCERTSVVVQEGELDEAGLRQQLPQHQVVIHCTPVGMHPHVDQSVVPGALLGSHLTAMDIVYNPLETRLLREAREAGCRVIRGLEMFLHQAVAQFELWTGQPAAVEVMRNVLEARFQ